MNLSEHSQQKAEVHPFKPLRVDVPASVLHDLRTPLNQIIGYSEMLIEQAQEDGLDAIAPDLQKIRVSGRQLLDKLNESFSALTGDDRQPGNISRQYSQESAAPRVVDYPPSQNLGKDAWSNANPASGKILIVDDGQQNRDVLSKRLVRQGHEVVAAASGAEALSLIYGQLFDLVLLDIMMPDVDGFEVLRQLKQDPAVSDIPVVMISALSAVDDIAKCIALGADDYLSKPFEPALLKARVGVCLDKKAARDREKGLFVQLQQSFDRLQALEKQRDDLTNMIVHDLRTPMTSIIGGLKSLDLAGNLNAEQQEMMRIAISGGDTLLGMINDLLDVEKIGAGAMRLDRVAVSIPEIIASAVMQVANLAEGKQLSIDYQIAGVLPTVSADRDRLTRVVVNLLGNAIKFTPSNGRITVAAYQATDGQSVSVSVADTGEGIPAEAIDSIFEKFTQVATRRGGRTMSTGLGLAFCKLAIEAHGGSIKVSSDIGCGSVFTLTLPSKQ